MSSVIQRVLVFPSCPAAILAASHSLSVTRRVRFSAFSSFRDRPAPGRWPPHLVTLSIFSPLAFFERVISLFLIAHFRGRVSGFRIKDAALLQSSPHMWGCFQSQAC